MRRSNLSYKTHLLRISVILCLLSSYFWIAPSQIHALSVGFQEYYVLGNEEHIWRTFDRIQGQEGGSSISTNMCSVVALVATADNQVVYYDHWEDGYEADLLNPTQGSTEVYGDGDTGNGGTGSDILVAGDIITLNSDQNDSTKNGYVSVNPRNPSDTRYDGGDRLITIGGPVDLAHAVWPYDQSYIGGAWEIYSLQAYQLAYSYRLPIGEDLYAYGGGDTGYFGDFQYVDLQLQALYDDTTVSIDNGTDTVNITLDKGQTYSSMGYIMSAPHADTLAITINAGTTILSDKQTQVGLVTGSDGTFQTRLLIILPDLVWGTEYIAPVPRGISPIGGYGDREAEVYIFNPNDYDISVTAYDSSGTGTFSIASNAISSAVAYSQPAVMNRYVPVDSAVRLVSGDPFGVIVVADTSHTAYDWGLSAIPVKYLTQDYYISWAPGSSNNPPTENGSPVWVTPLADDTTFYVDYGPVDGTVDLTFSLDTLEQGRIFDPDNDNTGMHVWATG
ncbi:MAG: hypothetical protein OEW09_09265, partial [Anaerolineae bacterium]|nr:hypothetical protein [Anaerolineae bacterium]